MLKYVSRALLLLLFLVVVKEVWSYNKYKVRNLPESNKVSLYVHQAKSFLQGRLELEYATYHDVSLYNGRHYCVFPPFPALLLVPFVALFGATFTKVTLISVALSILNIFTLTLILKKLKIGPEFTPWILVAFFLGTVYWSCVGLSEGVWYFAHIVSVACMLLAINEALGKCRGVLLGLFLGMAFLSRQSSIYSVLFICVMSWENARFESRKAKIENILKCMGPLAFCVAVYLALNWIRFGNVFDTGYSYIALSRFLKSRVDEYGLFNIAYVPFNFINMFFSGFHLKFPGLTRMSLLDARTNPFGTSILSASPFIFAAFFAKWKKSLLWAAWISISVPIVQALFYYNNGWVQINGHRFSLDYFPIIIVLVALGAKHVPEKLWKGAIVYSVVLNVLAVYCWIHY